MNEEIELLIERYLKDEMSSEERNQFENRLTSDPELLEAYEITQAAHKLVEEAGRLDLKQTLEGFEDRAKKSRVIKLPMRAFARIAAVLVLAIGAYMFFNFGGSMTKDEAFESYFEPYANPSVLRSSDEETINWNKAVQSYNTGDYDLALEYFERAGGDVHYTTVEFYQGMSYLLMDYPDFTDAEYYFNQVREDDSDFKEQANWYYGLVVMKQGKNREAEQVFKEIVKNKSYNHRNAKKLLNMKIKDH